MNPRFQLKRSVVAIALFGLIFALSFKSSLSEKSVVTKTFGKSIDIPVVITFSNSSNLIPSTNPNPLPQSVGNRTVSGHKKIKRRRRFRPFHRSNTDSGTRNFRILKKLVMNSLNLPSAVHHLQVLKSKLLNYYDKSSKQIGSKSSRDVGIGFPSLEGALLSLAFLTFAVFLIDLIQTLLTRITTGNLIGNTGISGGGIFGRRRRSLNEQSNETNNPSVDDLADITSFVVSSIERPFFFLFNE